MQSHMATTLHAKIAAEIAVFRIVVKVVTAYQMLSKENTGEYHKTLQNVPKVRMKTRFNVEPLASVSKSLDRSSGARGVRF